MYLDLEGQWRSKGVRQRVHDVEIRTAGSGGEPGGAAAAAAAAGAETRARRGGGGGGGGGLPAAAAATPALRWVFVRLREDQPPGELPSDVYAYGLDALVARMQAEQERKKAERLRQGR
ncbi:hypothetical protein I4F81_004611 [Pyropia yezoensis]|uniref:Uncharacterized protein n=1 Tax=Pyropia yezoensis TaxID=2788 RepID=A0ACC3BVS9_PYRYE|nr:hypothetical protein I4F81_004611 [Neopyropia yezoensis]